MPSKSNEKWQDGEVSSGEGVDSKPRFSQKSKRHCSKWWWLYLLAFIVVVVVVVIPIIFVGGRKVAQRSIDKATVVVDSQALTNPGPDSFSLQVNTTVESHTEKEATIDGFNGTFYLLDANPDMIPFAYASFPRVQVEAFNDVSATQSSVAINNMDQFIAFNKLALGSEEFKVGVYGKTHLKSGSLPKYPVTWDKVVTMKGFNKFAGLRISSVQFHLPPLDDGATMTGTVMIPNPSVISAQFGNITLDLSTNGVSLGTSLLPYVAMVPGNNTFNMRGYINTTLALQYVQDYVLDLEIRGNSCVNIGGQHLVYYEEALRSNTINYKLNLTEATSTSS